MAELPRAVRGRTCTVMITYNIFFFWGGGGGSWAFWGEAATPPIP